MLHPTITLPTRGDEDSAGYDFYMPVDVVLLPGEKKTVPTNVKAYMQRGEVLKLYPRSSAGTKRGIVLSNTVGIIDTSYYENEENDGNIGLPLHNTTGQGITLKAGERVVQGIFMPYLVADGDATLKEKRTGGFGSSGE